jgi:hypothetical protein
MVKGFRQGLNGHIEIRTGLYKKRGVRCMLLWVYLPYPNQLYIYTSMYVYVIMGDSVSANREVKRGGWTEQRRLTILQCESIIVEAVPCTIEKILSEIEYQTGLTNNKAKEIMNIFFNRGVVKLENDKEGVKVVVLNEPRND